MSRVLYRIAAASVINLDPISQSGSSNLPLGIGRAALNQELLSITDIHDLTTHGTYSHAMLPCVR